MITPQAGHHLPPEMIAAFIDARLSQAERNTAIEHLATCDNCRALVAGTVQTIDELHPAIGRNRYCGPGVLAILANVTTDAAARALRHVTGRRAITGTRPADLVLTAREVYNLRLGWDHRPDPFVNGKTLERVAGSLSSGLYLVYITGHYCALRKTAETIEVCDNKTIYPLAIERYKGRRKRVKAIWKVNP